MKYFKGLSVYIVIFVIILFMVTILTSPGTSYQMSYSELLSQIKNNNVQSVVLKGDEATVKLIKQKQDAKGTPEYVVYVSSADSFTNLMTEAYYNDQVKNFKVEPPPSGPWWMSILPTIVVIVLFILFWVFFLQQSQGGGGNRVMSFGKSRAKIDRKSTRLNSSH